MRVAGQAAGGSVSGVGAASKAWTRGLRRNDRMAKEAAAGIVTGPKPPAGKGLESALQELISNVPAVKRVLVQARERGFVTHDEINAALPEDELVADLTLAARLVNLNVGTRVIGVASRADEIGAGRIDAMLSANDVATRFTVEMERTGTCQAVVPVSGLLALTARTLRQSEFVALEKLAGVDAAELTKAMLSVDRFVREDSSLPVDAATRAALLDRFGMFGIRISIAVLRAGVSDCEVQWNAIEERRIGERYALATEVVGDVERQRVLARTHRVAVEQRPVGAAFGVRVHGGNRCQARRAGGCKVDAHAGSRPAAGGVQHMRRELAHRDPLCDAHASSSGGFRGGR